jgi:hypothetical protein
MVLVATAAVAKDLAPFRATLAVHWGSGAGSDAFRDDLARSLASSLATGCFAGVAMARADSADETSDVVFDVLLSDAIDETRFDDSIAGALQPGEPTKELRRVSHFEVTVEASLTTRESGALVQKKHLVAHVTRRPLYVGEDVQATVRAEAIDDIVRDLTRALGCGGAKLPQKIREALGEAGKASPAPR